MALLAGRIHFPCPRSMLVVTHANRIECSEEAAPAPNKATVSVSATERPLRIRAARCAPVSHPPAQRSAPPLPPLGALSSGGRFQRNRQPQNAASLPVRFPASASTVAGRWGRGKWAAAPDQRPGLAHRLRGGCSGAGDAIDIGAAPIRDRDRIAAFVAYTVRAQVEGVIENMAAAIALDAVARRGAHRGHRSVSSDPRAADHRIMPPKQTAYFIRDGRLPEIDQTYNKSYTMPLLMKLATSFGH